MPTNNKIHSSNAPSSGGGGGGDATAANQVTGNNTLTNINTNVNNTNALVTTSNTRLQTIIDELKVSNGVNTGVPAADVLDGIYKATTTTSTSAGVADISELILQQVTGLNTRGQSSMLGSLPVAIATNQTAIPITRTLAPATTGSITTSTSTVTVTNLNDTGAVTVSVYGTYTGVNFTFEAFDSINWIVVPAQRVDTGDLESATGVIASVIRVWNVSPLLGFTQFRVRATAYTSGTASIILQPSSQFVPIQIRAGLVTGSSTVGSVASITTSIVPGTAATNLGKAEDAVSASGDTGVFILGVRRDAPVVSASANGDYNELAVNRWGSQLVANYEKTAKTFSGSANITVAASATDIAILPGNATNSVYVTKVSISGIATSAGSALVQLVKRSTANSGGTSTSITSVAHDNADSAVSLPLQYTANPTPGTAVGNLRSQYVGLGTSTVNGTVLTWEFGDKGKHILLSGTGQGLAINLNGATIAGGNINVYYEWIEI